MEDVIAGRSEDDSVYGFAPMAGPIGTDSECSDFGSESSSDDDSPSLKQVDPCSHYDSNDDKEYSGMEELAFIREPHHSWKIMTTRWIESPPALLLKNI